MLTKPEQDLIMRKAQKWTAATITARRKVSKQEITERMGMLMILKAKEALRATLGEVG